MKCAAKWVGVISAVLLVAGMLLIAGQLYAQGENPDKPAAKLVWQPGVGWGQSGPASNRELAMCRRLWSSAWVRCAV